MIVSGNFQTVQAQRQAVTMLTGDVFGRTNIIASSGSEGGPHAYLVEQSPEVTLPPHFHLTEQFQVVLAGSGMLGRSHALQPLTVHYARGKTAYGPIVAGSAGLSYLTLRPQIEYGGYYLSDPKTVVDRQAPKFQTTSSAVPPATTSALATAPPAPPVEMIKPDASGLAVWLSRLPAGVPLSAPAHGVPADRFYVVTGGSAVLQAETLPPWSCVWMSAGKPSSHLTAGPRGAELLTLQFPYKSTTLMAGSPAAANA